MEYCVSIQNLQKIFEISIFQKSLSLLRILFSKRNSQTLVVRKNTIRAVDGVSLEITEGERVGIIGRNGAGKTTLLQMISGLAVPTSGIIEVKGHVNCVMTLGVGLREDLNGRENIYIDGEVNGKSKGEIGRIIDDIISFADIGEFIDYPVKTYSTGMKARLAFALIVFIEPEILIIDEALSAGDAQFSIKASAKMKEICSKGKILILVSHSMDSIVSMCNRCIWMDQGKIVMDGDPEIVTKAYVSAVRKEEERKLKSRLQDNSKILVQGHEITHLEFVDKEGISRKIYNVGEEMTIKFGVKCEQIINKPDFKISIERNDGILLLLREQPLILAVWKLEFQY